MKQKVKKEHKIEKINLKKYEQLELSSGFLNILYWFFAYPDMKITLSELAKELGIAKTTASRIVNDLLKENFLVVEEIGRAWGISCNINHPYNKTIKIGYNLQQIYLSGIIEEIYKQIGNPKAIILFGSYRKGDDISKSDLDIAVEVVGNEELKIFTLGNLPLLGLRKDVPINLYIFSRNKVDLNIFANIANGIVLDGFLEVRS